MTLVLQARRRARWFFVFFISFPSTRRLHDVVMLAVYFTFAWAHKGHPPLPNLQQPQQPPC